MNNYKIISDKDNIILKKNDNKFKLNSKSKVKKKCNIIELAENYEIYNLFKLLNEKLIHKLKIIKKDNSDKKNEADIIIFFNNIMKNDEDSEDSEDSNDDDNKNYYISFTNIINKKCENSITLFGNKNHISIDKENYKKMDIDNILLNITLVNDELEINLSFEYVGEKILIIMENTLGLVFRKIIKNLILYYSE